MATAYSIVLCSNPLSSAQVFVENFNMVLPFRMIAFLGVLSFSLLASGVRGDALNPRIHLAVEVTSPGVQPFVLYERIENGFAARLKLNRMFSVVIGAEPITRTVGGSVILHIELFKYGERIGATKGALKEDKASSIAVGSYAFLDSLEGSGARISNEDDIHILVHHAMLR